MKTISILLAALALSACAVKNPPPTIAYDTDDFVPAAVAKTPLPVEIVEVPLPLPLPGQLKPIRSSQPRDKDDSLLPEDRVIAANEAARFEPKANQYINAVQVYPFTEGALYQLYAAPEQVTDIALQKAEKLISVSAGDTVRWILGDTTSGEGESAQVHILVKPIAADLKTNLVITTDRRTYHLDLQSADDTYMAALSWTYPRDELIAIRHRNKLALEEDARTVDQGLDLQNLRFRYAISGDEPPWRPVRAFDDGSKVYIQFPRRLDQGKAPPLFVVGPKGDSQLVNYRVRGVYYIVDRLFAAAELRLGEDPQAVVRVSRTDGRETDS